MAEFAGAGKVEGLEVWRIENLAPVKLPQSTSKFHVGDSYIVLSTFLKSGKLSHNIHFWLGSETSIDEAGVAAYKTVELDQQLGGTAVQYREVQESESSLFLSYFKSNGGIEYCPGGVASGFRKVEVDVYPTRLLHLKGKRTVRVSEVPLSGASLNNSDVFILDNGLKIFIFNGPNANKYEKTKGIEVASKINGNERGGRATIVFLDDDIQNTEFWSQLGGFVEPSSLPDGPADVEVAETVYPPQLHRISNESGELVVTLVDSPDNKLQKSMLVSGDVFILLSQAGKVFIWVGSSADPSEKREAMPHALHFMQQRGIPSSVQVERMNEGAESTAFKSLFADWTSKSNKVVAADVTAAEVLRQRTAAETPVDDGSGKVTVWVIHNMQKVEVPVQNHGHFYSGDSYIVLYKYQKKGSEQFIIYFWQGRDSSADERGASALLTKELDESLGGRPVQVRIVQGKEPSHFKQIFKGNMIVHSGGHASGFHGSAGDSYDTDGVALFHIRGLNRFDIATLQVPEVAASLNSEDAFVLVDSSNAWVWKGSKSNDVESAAAVSVATILAGNYNGKGGRVVQEISEHEEPEEFWSVIGGKGSYADFSNHIEVIREARLFSASTATGRFKVEEISSFDQTDLNDEDVFLLDTGSQLFVWVGNQATREEREKADRFAQDYLLEIRADPSTSVAVVQSGQEPPMFTCHFINWDDQYFTKTYADPYEAKLKLIKEKQAAARAAEDTPAPAAPAPATPAPAVPVAAAAAGATFSYDVLKSSTPAGVDPARKEEYLSDAEFTAVFKSDRATFMALPKWKRDAAKKAAGIF